VDAFDQSAGELEGVLRFEVAIRAGGPQDHYTYLGHVLFVRSSCVRSFRAVRPSEFHNVWSQSRGPA
jgi:hypothetical protein